MSAPQEERTIPHHTDAEYDRLETRSVHAALVADRKIMELRAQLKRSVVAGERAVKMLKEDEVHIQELQAELDRLRKEVPPKDATAIFVEIPEEVKVFNLRIWGYATPYSHSEPEHEIIWRISQDQNAPEFFPNDGKAEHYKPFKGWS